MSRTATPGAELDLAAGIGAGDALSPPDPVPGKAFQAALEDQESPAPVLRSRLLAETCPWLIHGFSTRAGGVSGGPFTTLNLGLHVGDRPDAVVENRRRFLRSVYGERGTLDSLVAAQQVHGIQVAEVGFNHAGSGSVLYATALEGVDALATSTAGLALTLFFADCVPVLLAAPDHRLVCVVHAGWKGTAGAIVRKAVGFLEDRYGVPARSWAAWIGPSVGPCCYEVETHVADAVRAASSGVLEIGAGAAGSVTGQSGRRIALNLKQANMAQLQTTGVPSDRIEIAPDCTACRTDHYFSYRREGSTGRMALTAMITTGTG